MEYRMYRNGWDGLNGYYVDLQGEWAKTKKAAKASYKAALKARHKANRTAAKEGAQ